jgi:hypothetical protein
MATRTYAGLTAAFTTASTFAPKYRGIDFIDPVEQVERIDVTDFGSTGTRKYIFQSLSTLGGVELTFIWEGVKPPLKTDDTLTITFPGNGTLAGTGQVTAYNPEAGDTEESGAQMATLTFMWDGQTGPTVTPPA